MLKDFLSVLLIILGVVSIPVLVFGLSAWLGRRSVSRLSGRQLVMEGHLKLVAHGNIISTRGYRPITYPVTVVYLEDGRSCTILDTMLVRFPPGTRIAIWRDRSDDRLSIERYREE